MANLQGSDYPKQIKDALIRTDSRHQSQNGDHLTHGNETYKSRKRLLEGMAKLLTSLNIIGKLNVEMTEDLMDIFLLEIFNGVKLSTQKKDLSVLSSLFKGLEEANIRTNLSPQYFKDKRIEIKNTYNGTSDKVIKNRYVYNAEDFIANVAKKSVVTAVYAKVMHQLGFRHHEGFELLNNPDKYLQNRGLDNANQALFIVRKMQGKGGRKYIDKDISKELVREIKALDKIPSKSTLYRHLGKHSAHDFRFTYARNQMNKYLAEGYTYKESLGFVSVDLNHNRIEITRYYLRRTE